MQKNDFYDLLLLQEQNTEKTTVASNKAFKKLSKKRRAEYTEFKMKHNSSYKEMVEFFEVVAKRHPKMFSNYDSFMNLFDNLMEGQEQERFIAIQEYKDDARNAKTPNDRVNVQRLWIKYDKDMEKNYDSYTFSLSDIAPINNKEYVYKAKNEDLKSLFAKMSYIEKKRVFYVIDVYVNKKKDEASEDYDNFFEEIFAAEKAIKDEHSRQLELEKQTARENAERNRQEIDREKARRGGVEYHYTLSDYDNRSGVSIGRNARSFYLMKDGSGTFDSQFGIDKYIKKESIDFTSNALMANPIMIINGNYYVVVESRKY